MRKLSILLITTLLISSCTSSAKVNSTGFVAPCDQIKLAESEEKSLVLPCLGGLGEINFYQLKGPLVVNVWGSWCEGCRQEMPYFVDLYATQSFKSGEIQLLGIDVEEDSPNSGPDYIKQNGMSWPHLNDIEDKTKAIFGQGVPVTWFIDSNGVVVNKHIGAYQNKKQLFNQVEKAFGITL